MAQRRDVLHRRPRFIPRRCARERRHVPPDQGRRAESTSPASSPALVDSAIACRTWRCWGRTPGAVRSGPRPRPRAD